MSPPARSPPRSRLRRPRRSLVSPSSSSPPSSGSPAGRLVGVGEIEILEQPPRQVAKAAWSSIVRARHRARRRPSPRSRRDQLEAAREAPWGGASPVSRCAGDQADRGRQRHFLGGPARGGSHPARTRASARIVRDWRGRHPWPARRAPRRGRSRAHRTRRASRSAGARTRVQRIVMSAAEARSGIGGAARLGDQPRLERGPGEERRRRLAGRPALASEAKATSALGAVMCAIAARRSPALPASFGRRRNSSRGGQARIAFGRRLCATLSGRSLPNTRW